MVPTPVPEHAHSLGRRIGVFEHLVLLEVRLRCSYWSSRVQLMDPIAEQAQGNLVLTVVLMAPIPCQAGLLSL